jgi:steroid 5-alpha reductase family enzyme
MLGAGLLMLGGTAGVAKAHAAALIFYGARLNAFLLYRELAGVGPSMERKPGATVLERLKRLPILLSCGLLYFCMAAPLRITAVQELLRGHPALPAAGSSVGVTAAVALTFVNFGVAGFSDLYKSFVKARKGPDTLVTTGPFRWFRHPNYTFELFGWTTSFLAGVLAALQGPLPVKDLLPWLGASALGWVGILGVLAAEAAAGLEKKQKEKYGGTPEYEDWVKRSWAGPSIGPGLG